MGAKERERRSAPLWADLGLGFVSGAIIPAPVIVILDMGLLVLGLWYVYTDVTQLGARGDQSLWSALGTTVAANLLNILGQLWAIRWVLLASGCMGALIAVVQRASSRISRPWGRGLSFMVTLAVLSLFLNGLFLIWRESQARLVAANRTIFFLRQLQGESYGVNLVVGLVAALIIAFLYWEAWRAFYGGIRSRLGLPQLRPVFAAPSTLASDRPASAPEWRAGEYTTHLAALRREALAGVRLSPSGGSAPSAPPSARGQQTDAEVSAVPDPRGVIWAGALVLLCVAAWLPLDSGYRRHAPRTISDSVYLQPSKPERGLWVSIGASPHEIVLASAVGHGLLDAELLASREAAAPIRTVRDVELRETPEGSHTYAHMPIEGLKPGNYYLRLHLRPLGDVQAEASAIMRDGEAIVSYSLYGGGGTTYRLIAVGMAVVLTLGVLCVIVLTVEGVSYLRSR